MDTFVNKPHNASESDCFIRVEYYTRHTSYIIAIATDEICVYN